MSDMPPDSAPPTDLDNEDLTAAEYALGVLSRADRAVAEARAARDPEFAKDTLAWVMRLAPMIEDVTPVEPSAALWQRIEAAIDRPLRQTAASVEAPVADP